MVDFWRPKPPLFIHRWFVSNSHFKFGEGTPPGWGSLCLGRVGPHQGASWANDRTI